MFILIFILWITVGFITAIVFLKTVLIEEIREDGKICSELYTLMGVFTLTGLLAPIILLSVYIIETLPKKLKGSSKPNFLKKFEKWIIGEEHYKETTKRI